jgi:hypothetical protein
MIREKPVAIAKNAVAEGMSRMMGKEVKSTLQHEPDPARGKKFPFTISTGSRLVKKNTAKPLFPRAYCESM